MQRHRQGILPIPTHRSYLVLGPQNIKAGGHLSRDSPLSLLLATPHSPECQASRVRTFTTMFSQPPFIILLALLARPIIVNAAETPGKRSFTAPLSPSHSRKAKIRKCPLHCSSARPVVASHAPPQACLLPCQLALANEPDLSIWRTLRVDWPGSSG